MSGATADVTTGVGDKGNEIEPKRHGTFDDSKWEVLKPETLGKARGPGGYSWCWYRIKVTIPDEIGGKKFDGGPVWIQTTVDDYGEIWVDGKMDQAYGKSGRGAVSGFNTLNRVRLQKEEAALVDGKKKTSKRDAKPGDVFQIAVLGINSPLGNPPGNNIFLRSPTNLEFFTRDAKDGGANVPKTAPPPAGKMIAEIDLMSKDGVAAIKGEWRRQLLTFHTGPKKNGIEPKAHGKFDDSKWEVLADPAMLKKPFGPGKFSMAWYRIKVTIPTTVVMTTKSKDKSVPDVLTQVDVADADVWFRTTVDDYAEIWVDGKIDAPFNTSGRARSAASTRPTRSSWARPSLGKRSRSRCWPSMVRLAIRRAIRSFSTRRRCCGSMPRSRRRIPSRKKCQPWVVVRVAGKRAGEPPAPRAVPREHTSRARVWVNSNAAPLRREAGRAGSGLAPSCVLRRRGASR